MLDWLAKLPKRASLKCVVRIELLKERGHELRRPYADYLRDDIHELRVKESGINYRIFYFFHGRNTAIVSHGIMKQRATVPSREIDVAIQRKARFVADPAKHTHHEA